MRIDVAPTAAALTQIDLSRWRIVVIDAVRASSTIAQAIVSGARRVIPVATVEEALARKAALGGEEIILGGERRGLPIPGFDLGNSPAEYDRATVSGRTIVFTTTNGTPAILASQGASEALVGAFVNLPAVTARLAATGGDVLLAAAGRDGAPVLDDVVCAGMYVDRLVALAHDCDVTDPARLAWFAYRGYRGRIEDALRESPSGQALIETGLVDDLTFCAQVGACNAIPRLVCGEVLSTS